jgi:hypothetical protein
MVHCGLSTSRFEKSVEACKRPGDKRGSKQKLRTTTMSTTKTIIQKKEFDALR